ncbi:LBP (LPS binding protein)/BPI (bactericidal/permeability-increasing protein)-1 precursor-like [Scleropages formosus]|uniref:Bactericidal permeability-increasing protein n=1 Tax=Scleropages formosus TaxID=113540 RepID=A0A0P7U8U2_SCLFO|nr:LBP (LPS binding protein)/BPI (bactericidal/permeability-increasing protein)-1 precursor-like [Scleropages formosus]
MHITNLGLPASSLGLVPGSGLSLSISDAFISLNGHWHVKYLKFIKDSGSFDLTVSGLTISVTMGVNSDETGRPTVSSSNCAASVGHVSIEFHGGASWLYNLFSSFIENALRSAIQNQICPLVHDAISDINPHLKTMNVLAQVDKYAEIEYSLVTSPVVSNTFIQFSLKGEFYKIGQHQEPPFSAPPFSLPQTNGSMLYLGLSSFIANSAGFVYHNAGVLGLYVTDDMIPSSSPLRLNTKTFGAFIPEIAKRFPNMMMKLLVKTLEPPRITFEPNNVTLQANGTVTAYAILPNNTLEALFILNLVSLDGQGEQFICSKGRPITEQIISMTLGTSYVGQFQVMPLNNIFTMILKVVVIPKVNEKLQQGYPLPAISHMNLVNTQLKVLKDQLVAPNEVVVDPRRLFPENSYELLQAALFHLSRDVVMETRFPEVATVTESHLPHAVGKKEAHAVAHFLHQGEGLLVILFCLPAEPHDEVTTKTHP